MNLIEITPGHWLDPDDVVAVEPGMTRVVNDARRPGELREVKTSRVFLRAKHYLIVDLSPGEVVAKIEAVRAEVARKLAEGWAAAAKQGPGPIVVAADQMKDGPRLAAYDSGNSRIAGVEICAWDDGLAFCIESPMKVGPHHRFCRWHQS